LSIYPVVSVLPYSFTHWSGIGPIHFIGLENFFTIFKTQSLMSELLNSFKNTYVLLFLTYFLYNPIIIVVSYMLFKKIVGSSLYKAVLFMPQFINAVAVTFIVTLFFSPNIGLYSSVLKAVGLGKWAIPGIWQNPAYGVPLVLLVGVWRGMGYEILLYIAGFSSVPIELEEAAKIDGAGEVRRFMHIYFPLIAPTFTNVVVLMYIWTLTTFDIPYLLGGVSGGVNGSMDTIQLFFYRTVFGRSAYSDNLMGMGSALSIIILAAIVTGSLLLQRYLSKREISY
jgi:raffinose/stachyose/melibiose transport system permease protein